MIFLGPLPSSALCVSLSPFSILDSTGLFSSLLFGGGGVWKLYISFDKIWCTNNDFPPFLFNSCCYGSQSSSMDCSELPDNIASKAHEL